MPSKKEKRRRTKLVLLLRNNGKTAYLERIDNVERNIGRLNRKSDFVVFFSFRLFALIIFLLLNALLPTWATETLTNELSPEEQAWLDNNHTVRVRVGDHPPWHINSPDPQGIVVDYLTIIGKQFGINFKFIPDKEPWIVGFNDIAGEHLRFDLYPTANRTPERLEYLAMTDNYLHSPWVIFVRNKTFDVYNIDDLRRRKVSVERGYVMQKMLEKNNPEIELVILDSTEDALLALSTKKVDAYIGNLIITSYLIQRSGITNIKVASPTPFGYHSQAMATRKEWAALISIINKGLDSIPPKEKTKIQNKYVTVRFEHGIRTIDIVKWVIGVASIFLTIIAIISFWNRRLNKEITERIKAEEKQKELENSLKKKNRELNDAKSKAEQQARTDALTGLHNRRGFFEHCNMLIGQTRRYQHSCSFIMLDIDHFKRINDRHGHAAGDKVIKVLANAITRGIRVSDVSGRVGGEEFAIILPETMAEVAKDLAERLRESISNIVVPLDGCELKFSASFGIAEYRDGDTSIGEMMARADAALYQAKEQGRNRVVQAKEQGRDKVVKTQPGGSGNMDHSSA